MPEQKIKHRCGLMRKYNNEPAYIKMKRLKRLIAVFMILLSVWLCSCTAENKNNEKTEENLIIGSDIYAPYFYIAENGDFTGVDVEIAREACGRMNMNPVFKNINWQNKDADLESGKVDCLWGSFSMTGREDLYNWAGPYLKSRQVLVVRDSSNFRKLNDLNGKSIAVQNGSKPEKLFLKGEVSQLQNPGNIYSFSSINTVFAALRKGYVDACAGHEAALNKLIENSSGKYRILDEPILDVELGVAFLNGKNEKTAEKLTKTLGEMIKDGTIDGILEKYGLDPKQMIGEWRQ